MRTLKRLIAITVFGTLILLIGCSGTLNKQMTLTTVDSVDTNRYSGDWYIIANIPYFAERGKVAGRVTYQPRDDGRFDDLYHFRKRNFDQPEKTMKGVAWTLNDEKTHWRSRFYWPLTFDFYIIGLDPEYQTVALGHPSREYGWLMSRQRFISDEQYQQWMDLFETQGYQREQFFKVPQQPQDIGKPGYQ